MAHIASFQFEGSLEGWIKAAGGGGSGELSVSTVQKRTGESSLLVGVDCTAVGQMGTALSLAYLGLSNYQINNMNTFFFGVRNSAGVNVARLQFDAVGHPTLHYQGGAATLTNTEFLYTLDNEHYLEMFAEIGSSADIICKIDGDIVISLIGADTRASAGAITTVDEIVVYTPFSSTCYIDDVWVDDANWPDGIRLLPVDIDGDGAHTAWAASGGGAKYQYVDDFDPIDEDDYVQDATGNQKISFTIAALPALGANVEFVGVQVVHYSHEPNGVSGKTLDPFLRVDGGDFQDAVEHELTADVRFYQGKMHEENPDTTAPWADDTEIGGIEIGLKSSA